MPAHLVCHRAVREHLALPEAAAMEANFLAWQAQSNYRVRTHRLVRPPLHRRLSDSQRLVTPRPAHRTRTITEGGRFAMRIDEINSFNSRSFRCSLICDVVIFITAHTHFADNGQVFSPFRVCERSARVITRHIETTTALSSALRLHMDGSCSHSRVNLSASKKLSPRSETVR